MKTFFYPAATACLLFMMAACETSKYADELPVVKDSISFSQDIQPILNKQCAGCHNPANVAPDLRTGYGYESLMEDGEGIVPGDSEGSELMEMLERKSADGNNMPPSTPLAPLDLALIQKWINEGAKNN